MLFIDERCLKLYISVLCTASILLWTLWESVIGVWGRTIKMFCFVLFWLLSHFRSFCICWDTEHSSWAKITIGNGWVKEILHSWEGKKGGQKGPFCFSYPIIKYIHPAEISCLLHFNPHNIKLCEERKWIE